MLQTAKVCFVLIEQDGDVALSDGVGMRRAKHLAVEDQFPEADVADRSGTIAGADETESPAQTSEGDIIVLGP